MGKVVEIEGVRGLSLPSKTELSKAQLAQTVELSKEIAFTLGILKGAKKLGVEKRSNVLSKLIKGQEALVKTQRLILGMDSDSGGLVNKGVIIIPGKVINWPDAAKKEISDAKLLLSPGGKLDESEDKGPYNKKADATVDSDVPDPLED